MTEIEDSRKDGWKDRNRRCEKRLEMQSRLIFSRGIIWCYSKFFLKSGPSLASFCFFVLFKQKLYRQNCRRQQDSNLDRWSRSRACWQLEHHLGPKWTIFEGRSPGLVVLGWDLQSNGRVGSNRNTVYWTDIFHKFSCKICLKKA